MTSATLKLAKVVSFIRRTSDVRFFQCLQISMKLLQYRINGQFDPFDIGTGGRRLLLKHRSATPRRLCRSLTSDQNFWGSFAYRLDRYSNNRGIIWIRFCIV